MASRIFGLVAISLLVSAGALADSPAVGSPAPEFRLQDQNGDWHTLEQYRGQWVAVYFYPKDDTPGCTTEACNFRDNIFAFRERNAVILGVSLDDVESHQAFAEKYSLPFSLLSDPEAEVADAYGVVTNLGITKFAKRQSFLIAPDGTVAKHYAKVDPDTHSKEILADLMALQDKPSS
ncbi:MAG: peroxiredoxin [Gammaproteobacteria bacterium]|nr:MAG: peroxiredoxin [Gammaproteobacteria bacterium]